MSWWEVEYKECSTDWRFRDRLVWATPPVLITVSSILLGVAYGTLSDNAEARTVVLAIGTLFAFLMTLSLVRHRMFQEGSRELMDNLRPLFLPPIPLEWAINQKNPVYNPRKHYPQNFAPCIPLRWATPAHMSGGKTMELLSFFIFLGLFILTFYNLFHHVV